MALVGGGGAGNVAGSGGTAGTGKSLNYIGDHIFATSGETTTAGGGSADATLFDFTTGSSYIVGQIDFANDVKANYLTLLDLEFNGESVMAFGNDLESQFNQQPVKLDVLIPPFTHVVMKWGANIAEQGYAFLTGRVYA